MAGIGPYIKPIMRIGTPLKSTFKNGGMNGSGISKNIKMVEIAANTPTKVIICTLETERKGLFVKAALEMFSEVVLDIKKHPFLDTGKAGTVNFSEKVCGLQKR